MLPMQYDPKRKFLDSKHAYTCLKPEHDILAMSKVTYLALDSKQLPNCRKCSTTYYCENLLLVTHRRKHICGSAICWKKLQV